MWAGYLTVFAVITIALGGCGATHQSRDDGTTATSFHFGLVSSEECVPDKTTVVNAFNLGLWKDETSAGIGLQKLQYACLAPRCQVIFWVDDTVDAEKLKAQLGNPSNLCVLFQ